MGLLSYCQRFSPCVDLRFSDEEVLCIYPMVSKYLPKNAEYATYKGK